MAFTLGEKTAFFVGGAPSRKSRFFFFVPLGAITWENEFFSLVKRCLDDSSSKYQEIFEWANDYDDLSFTGL